MRRLVLLTLVVVATTMASLPVQAEAMPAAISRECFIGATRVDCSCVSAKTGDHQGWKQRCRDEQIGRSIGFAVPPPRPRAAIH
jgi:hypothetical protein